MRNLIVVLLAIVFLTGCSGLASREGQIATTLITMRVIENASDPAAKAARIRLAVDEIERHIEGDLLTLGALEVFVRSRIDRERLSASEVLLWDEAITAVMTDLRERAPRDGLLNAEGRAAAQATIDAIRRAILLEGY